MLFIGSEIVQFMYQLFKKNTKIIGFIGFLIMGYIAGTANPDTTLDYAAYKTYYDLAPSGIRYFEHGYSSLGVLFYKMGFDYASFRVFFAFMTVVIMYIGLIRFTKKIALISAIYGCTLFFVDATQIRNFMTLSIIVLAMSFLIEVSTRNVIISSILIFLSAQIQSVGYVFFLIIIVRLLPEKILRKGIPFFVGFNIFAILGVMIVGINRVQSVLVKIVTMLPTRDNLVYKISSQYGTGISHVRLIVIFAATLFGILLSWYLNNRIQSKGRIINNKMKILYVGILVTFMMLPIVYLSYDYSRIQRNGFLFLLIQIAIFSEQKIEKNTKFVAYLSFCMTSILYVGAFGYYWFATMRQSIPYLLKLM